MTKAESTLRDLDTAASKIGLQIQVARARTIGEIDAAFAAFAGERPDGRLHMQRCLADAAFASEEQMPRRCCQKLWYADHKSRFSRVKAAIIQALSPIHPSRAKACPEVPTRYPIAFARCERP
jgi:hypothetical protein